MVGRKDGEFLSSNGERRDIRDGSKLCRSMIWGIREKDDMFRNCINPYPANVEYRVSS
jgi:hypothetical protein